MVVAVVTATAGGTFTYALITGTTQEVVDELASRKQDKPTFKVLTMAYNGTNLSVLVLYGA